jgi:hypothetical protein
VIGHVIGGAKPHVLRSPAAGHSPALMEKGEAPSFLARLRGQLRS